MYTQAMDTMGKDRLDAPKAVRSADEIALQAKFDAAHRRRRLHRGQGLDARALPQDAGAPDQPARALGDRRHAARGQLDHARADPEAKGDPARQGAGRGRPRPLPLRCRRDPRHLARPALRRAAFRQGQVQLDLQLPDAQLGRHGHDRLARRRRGDHEPGAALPLLVRAVCAGDGAHLPRGVVPPAPGLRVAADDDEPRHRRAEGDGPGRGRSLVVAEHHDVRPARHRVAQLRAVDEVGHQADQQRRPAPEVHRRDGRAGEDPRRHPARSGPALERGTPALRLRRDRLERVLAGRRRRRAVQPRAPRGARGGLGRRRLGARRGPGPRGEEAVRLQEAA